MCIILKLFFLVGTNFSTEPKLNGFAFKSYAVELYLNLLICLCCRHLCRKQNNCGLLFKYSKLGCDINNIRIIL